MRLFPLLLRILDHRLSSVQLFRPKVVQKKRKSVRDNAERQSQNTPKNFNKSSESIMPRPYSEDLKYMAGKMDFELQFIGFFPDYLSALSHTLLRFFGQPLSK